MPAGKQREEVLEASERSQVVVISGATGCGKSTQVRSCASLELWPPPCRIGAPLCRLLEPVASRSRHPLHWIPRFLSFSSSSGHQTAAAVHATLSARNPAGSAL